MVHFGRVSIVIPCFNNGWFVTEAVASALEQTYHDIEVIVVDDGSTDPESLRALEACRGSQVTLLRQPNQGPSAARNAGIRISSGDYILPLDADDHISANYAQLAAEVLHRHPRIGIVCGGIEYFGLQTGQAWPTYDGIEGMLFKNNLYTCSLTRRADWEAVGGYPEHVRFAEDWIYWLRILNLGREVSVLDETVWFYRQRQDQAIRSMGTDTWSRAIIHAMRDQPELYARHMDVVIDHLDAKLEVLDNFRTRYGRLNNAASRMKSLGHRVRRSHPT